MNTLPGQPACDDSSHPSTPLTPADLWIRALRTGLQLLPFGAGSAIDSAIFGLHDDRRVKRLEGFMHALADDLRSAASGREAFAEINRDYLLTEEFRFVFEGVMRRVNIEIAHAKLAALRGVLVTVITHGTRFPFELQASFLRTLDLIDGTHIRVLQILAARFTLADGERFVSHGSICELLGATVEKDVNFVYSAIDTLANREFISSGPIPFDAQGRLEKPRQQFRATALGVEFLEFVRAAPGKPDAAASAQTA